MKTLLDHFVLESRDFLDRIGAALLELEKSPDNRMVINEVFRLVHTLKGNSGLFDVPQLTRLLHAAEDVLDRVRDAEMAMDRALTDTLLATTDVTAEMIDRMERASAIDDVLDDRSTELATALRTLMGSEPTGPVETASCETELDADAILNALDDTQRATLQALPPGQVLTALRYLPDQDCFFKGEDPLAMLRSAPGLVAFSIRRRDAWAPLERLDAYTCNLQIDAVSTAGEEALREHFEYVADQCQFVSVPVAGPATGTEDAGKTEPPPDSTITPAGNGQKTGREATVPVLKVPADRIDRLMELIGEMVVAKNGLPYIAERAEQIYGARELSREIKSQYTVINRIVEELHHGVMQVRMMPVGSVFQRFHRLVRDTANQLGKQVRLVIEGEDTEADKTIIEALGDPLIHLVRNALDHGLEMPEARRLAGKPEQGSLTVRARPEGDRVVIEIEDDGRGINSAAVRHKALERGLISETQAGEMSDEDINLLIFAPGFSTAEKVSNLSGRGVGMDAVKHAIERLGGEVSLSSRAGSGALVRLSLPLSISVSQMMLVSIAGQTYGVPMDHVLETGRVGGSDIHTVGHRLVALMRGKIVPLYSAYDCLQLAGEPARNAENECAVLVASVNGETFGLMVDGFLQTTDVIMKPLEGPLASLSFLSGTALMGDGGVLLILNLKGMV
ncbi:chemotaxis protein CheA [Rhizobium straminoryzae]|uniref:Chemotaxis protein CheA n=1 Tax=Rhizobium straminoryzae TaxID=1387186 RepID=A0A549T8H6_9HYPH|nr:chemotaxis protein CheA [Rhizobium straminoryzae]TRL38172.1 chemotaxis protein CheA [Rhizobium straminoryzae]